MTQTALILGANGRFGRNAAQQFRAAGWAVRGFDRANDDLRRAAQGADVIVNAWNPPYTDWATQVPMLHAQVRKAALETGALVIVPGNVYVFGPDTPAPWSQRSPHAATNALGRIRIEMEDAYASDGVRTLILRAGDFLDTERSGNWFDQIMIKALDKGVFTYPGNPEIPHAWAFLPDLTRAAVALAETRDAIATFADIAFPGYTLSGRQICRALGRVTGRDIRLKQMNWWPLRLAQPVWPMGRCLVEMRYLWNTPHALDGAAFQALLPAFRDTPTDQALAQAIGISPAPDQPRPDGDGWPSSPSDAGPVPVPANGHPIR